MNNHCGLNYCCPLPNTSQVKQEKEEVVAEVEDSRRHIGISTTLIRKNIWIIISIEGQQCHSSRDQILTGEHHGHCKRRSLDRRKTIVRSSNRDRRWKTTTTPSILAPVINCSIMYRRVKDRLYIAQQSVQQNTKHSPRHRLLQKNRAFH